MNSQGIIDLRSDTVTLPTPAMRTAMAQAELGDDVYGEDPTVNRLQAMAAQLLGKEAALLTTSGTMSNLVAMLTLCQRGDEVILGSEAHILHYEVGGAAALGGLQLRPLPNDWRGMIDPDLIEKTIRGPNIHFPRTGLVCLENTHNRCGGGVLSEAESAAVAAVAHRHGIPVYLDGARIFNAAIALGVPAASLVREVDAVSFCLSKGLAAPVGSLLCGSADFIERARRFRKMVGGGMRQAGVIAAAGIVALETMIDRLAEDHETARLLAQAMAEMPGLQLDPSRVVTNIVIVDTPGFPAEALRQELHRRGVLVNATGPQRLRFVTHYGVTPADIAEATTRLRDAIKALA